MTNKNMDERETLKKKQDQKEAQEEMQEESSEAMGEAEPVAEPETPKTEEAPDEDAQNKYLRLAADFQNYKRRVEKEKSDIYSYANEKIATDLLSVLDNFERAFDHAEDVADKGFVSGMQMIQKQLIGLLEKNGIAEIPTEGQPFDPNLHHAVMTEQAGDAASGTVTAVLQKGYTLNSKVIRHSMVKVAE